MPNCSVFCCKKRSATSNLQKDGVTFHMFPKDPNLRDIWKTFSNNRPTWIPTRNSVICSNHFKTSDFQVLANNRRRLVDGAKPTVTQNCICSNHQQSFNIADERLSSYDSINDARTIPNSLTSPCRSSTPQNAQSKETSKKSTSIPTTALTPRKRKMQQQLDYQKKKIKRLQAKNLFLKKKVAGLEEILQSLDEKALIDKEERMVLEKIGVEEAELIKRQLKKCKSGKLSRAKYSPELRCFALTLNFYSPKAYKYVRKTFGTCLPAPRTLTKWYSNIDGRPGFTKEALAALKYKADDCS